MIQLATRKVALSAAASALTLAIFSCAPAFAEVVPAAGATNAAVRIAPERMKGLVSGEWVDVCE